MLVLDRPVIVEGKYDRERLCRIVDGVILTTDGFGVFRNDEKRALIRRLAAPHGVIVLTDPDGAGLVIRNFLRGILPPEKVTHLYVPQRTGKEKRKTQPSAEGYLGVEGFDEETLTRLLAPYTVGAVPRPASVLLTKTDLYDMGLSGKPSSAASRDRAACAAGLPRGLSSNALLEALNLLGGRSFFEQLNLEDSGRDKE